MGITIGGKDWDELLNEIQNSSQWHSGVGPPSTALGKINDYYLNVDTGDVYKKINATTWDYQGNIRGPQGPQGFTYTHEQIAPAESWYIHHGLDRFPSVTVIDSGGSVVLGDVEYLSNNEVLISFVAAFSGKAYLN